MNEVTIRIRGFTYYEAVQDPTNSDNTIRQAKFATRGQTIKVDDQDYQRGLALDAFVTPETEEKDAEPFDVVAHTDDELVDWIQASKPKEQDMVDAAAGDPENAERLMQAEIAAQGGEDDARKGVMERLGKIAEGDDS